MNILNKRRRHKLPKKYIKDLMKEHLLNQDPPRINQSSIESQRDIDSVSMINNRNAKSIAGDSYHLKKKQKYMGLIIKLTKYTMIIIFLLMFLSVVPIWFKPYKLNLINMTVDNEPSLILFSDESLNMEVNETVSKSVRWKNNQFIPLYYRFYMNDIEGDSLNFITLTIKDQEDNILFSGYLSDFNEQNAIYSKKRLSFQRENEYIFTISLSEDFEPMNESVGFIAFNFVYEVSFLK